MQRDDVRRNYDVAASYYDVATNLVFHRLLGLYRWRRRLIARLDLSAGATVLDVGCGTGNNFPLIEKAIGPRGRIIGVDYSSGMLERARDRCRRARWSNVTLIQDDAESGRRYLRDHLEEMREERYLWNTGFLISGISVK